MGIGLLTPNVPMVMSTFVLLVVVQETATKADVMSLDDVR
jgi:hypothetical protein